jgi:hypothetical protein
MPNEMQKYCLSFGIWHLAFGIDDKIVAMDQNRMDSWLPHMFRWILGRC